MFCASSASAHSRVRLRRGTALCVARSTSLPGRVLGREAAVRLDGSPELALKRPKWRPDARGPPDCDGSLSAKGGLNGNAADPLPAKVRLHHARR